jgi:hypothetical protein
MNPNDWSAGSANANAAAATQAAQTAAATAPGNLSGAFNQGTNIPGGFASQYNPSQLNANIYQNPWAILPDVYKNINMQGAGYQALRNLGADPLTLYNIMTGTGNTAGGATNGNASDYTNWLAALYSQLGQVGGRNFSAPEMLQNIFNPGSGALSQIEKAGDASQQLRTLFNLAKDATNVGINPLAARGYQAALSNAGDQAMNQMLHNNANSGPNNVPIYQLISQIAPNLVPR